MASSLVRYKRLWLLSILIAILQVPCDRCSIKASCAVARHGGLAARKCQGRRCDVRRFASRQTAEQRVPSVDKATYDLHSVYHEKTVSYTVDNFDWVLARAGGTDGSLDETEQEKIWRISKERLSRWPHVSERDLHDVRLGPPGGQSFCPEGRGKALGDPMDNIFIINLPRRPVKVKNALHQLYSYGLNGKIVDGIDGDAFTSQEEVARVGARTLPNYVGHKNTLPHLTTGQLGCFMSHFAVWQHMVDNNIEAALILEDDFDLQENFKARLGQYLEEAKDQDWNLMYLGRSPTEEDVRRVSEHLAVPGYTLWTVAYIFRLEAAKALVEAQVQLRLAPLDHYFSVAMGQGFNGHWNENAVAWSKHIPQVLKGLAMTPPLVMPYVGSMFLSDTAMLRKGTKFVSDLPKLDTDPPTEGIHEAMWRAQQPERRFE